MASQQGLALTLSSFSGTPNRCTLLDRRCRTWACPSRDVLVDLSVLGWLPPSDEIARQCCNEGHLRVQHARWAVSGEYGLHGLRGAERDVHGQPTGCMHIRKPSWQVLPHDTTVKVPVNTCKFEPNCRILLRPVEGSAGQAACPLTVDCGLGMRIWGTGVPGDASSSQPRIARDCTAA